MNPFPHPCLLPYIPRRRLVALHATVCNLRGRQWGSQRPALLFVSRHSFHSLYAYHVRVLHELRSRGFRPSANWSMPTYRGKSIDPWPDYYPVPDPWYPCHTPDDYRRSLDHLRKRVHGLQDDDRIRLSIAPEEVV